MTHGTGTGHLYGSELNTQPDDQIHRPTHSQLGVQKNIPGIAETIMTFWRLGVKRLHHSESKTAK